MDLDQLITIFKEVSEAHVAGMRFYNGLEDEENPSYSEDYPAVLFLPITVAPAITENEIRKKYRCIMQVVDTLPTDRTQDDIAGILNKIDQIGLDIFIKAFVAYNRAKYTINNKLTFLNWNYSVHPIGTPLIDHEASNKVGFQYDFEIQADILWDSCQLTEKFP